MKERRRIAANEALRDSPGHCLSFSFFCLPRSPTSSVCLHHCCTVSANVIPSIICPSGVCFLPVLSASLSVLRSQMSSTKLKCPHISFLFRNQQGPHRQENHNGSSFSKEPFFLSSTPHLVNPSDALIPPPAHLFNTTPSHLWPSIPLFFLL